LVCVGKYDVGVVIVGCLCFWVVFVWDCCVVFCVEDVGISGCVGVVVLLCVWLWGEGEFYWVGVVEEGVFVNVFEVGLFGIGWD